MFVLNCEPDHGFVFSETNAKFKFGLDKEKCLERIDRADNEFAMNLMNQEERMIINPTNREEGFRRPESENSRRLIMTDLLNPLFIRKIYYYFIRCSFS